MGTLITSLISTILTQAVDYKDIMLSDLARIAFYPEEFLNTLLGVSFVDNINKYYFDLGMVLLVLKFLKKGFNVYMLGAEGDADLDPDVMLMGFIRAMIITIAFPIAYEFLADVFIEVTNKTVSLLTGGADASLEILLSIASGGLFSSILSLVFLIFYLILLVRFMKLGIELMFLRFGVPFASSGLMDSDGGVFKTYSSKFILTGFSILFQVAAVKLGFVLIINVHPFWACAALSAALSAPKLMNEFLVNWGGGASFSQNVYQNVRTGQIAFQAFSKIMR